MKSPFDTFHSTGSSIACLVACACLASTLVSGRAAGLQTRPPNFVLLFADDAGYADFGFQGSATHATPNIDSIAAAGVRFTDAYVSASVCSPSRAGLLTGRYQQRFGHEHNLPGMDDPRVPGRVRGLPVDELTVANLLGELGYATGIIGKWHLGMAPRFHPTERGFDEFFGLLRGSSPYLAGGERPIVSSYRDVDAPTLPYLTDAFGDEAVAFIDRHRDEPFFLFLSFTAPHTPLEAPDGALASARSAFETLERAANAAMTSVLDDNVGKVLRRLDDLGLADDTLVVFTNDNGGAMPSNASLNDPLRGTKGTVLEGGNRVPMAMRWPRILPGATTYGRPVITLDLLPTMVAAAGGELPVDRDYDGVDLLPYLRSERDGSPHDVLFWKLQWASAIRRGDWKLVRTPAGDEWLFDLADDIGETTDLLTREPERAALMGAELEAWEAGLPDPIWVIEDMWREHSLIRYDQTTVESFRRH